jgi:(p)ppGpp synthase/HD superfamily hydrolase
MIDEISMVDRAITFAARAHDGQYRKQTKTPYISHPFRVALLLLKLDCPETLVVAGLLHDTVEDAGVSLAEIIGKFGQEVAEIVAGCTEPDRTFPWEHRKQHTIDHLRHAPLPVKLVACADKFDNLRTIWAAYQENGDRVWDRFNRGRERQAWYYRNLVSSLRDGVEDLDTFPLFRRFEGLVQEVFG